MLAVIILVLVILYFSGILSKKDDGDGKDKDPDSQENGNNNGGSYYGGKAIYKDYIYTDGIIKDLDGNEITKIDEGFILYDGVTTLYEAKTSEKSVIVKALEKA